MATWTSLVPETTIDGYKVIPLTTSGMLQTESLLMRHSVRDYDENCYHGISRIFHVEAPETGNEGERHGTLELVYEPYECEWYINQFKGPANRNMSESMYIIAETIEDMYNDAWNS